MGRFYKTTSLEEYKERFYSRVKVMPNGCHEWQGGRFAKPHDYGAFWFRGKTVQAYRMAYFFAHKRWPAEFGCHNCDNPSCVRWHPRHVVEGDQKANMAHASEVGRSASGKRSGRYTKPERTARGDRHGTHTKPEAYVHLRGSGNSQAKLSELDVRVIRRLWKTGEYSQQRLANKYGVNQTLIGFIVRRVSWRHVR